MLNNFPVRLEAELTSSMTQTLKVRAPGRKYSAWIGGSIAASLSTFASTAITEEEYREEGPSIVHRKCL